LLLFFQQENFGNPKERFMKSNFVLRSSIQFALIVIASSACYDQAPLTTVPTPQTHLIAEVTDTGTVVMANAIGPGALEVEGVVADADQDTWKLSLTRVDHRGGSSVLWNHEVVSFPRFALTNATVKRVDKTRSWLVGALLAGGAILAAKMFTTGGNDDPNGNPPPPPHTRIPGVSWP